MKNENTKNLFYTTTDISAVETPKVANKVQYLDMSKIRFLNNSVIVMLINQAKTFMSKGIDVVFINVPDFLKRAIKKLGLDDIINCR